MVLLGAGYVLALVIAVVKWHQYPRASKYLFAAILLALLSRVVTMFLSIVLVRAAGTSNLPASMAALNVFQSLLTLVSLALMVVAVYVGRQEQSDPRDEEYLPGQPSTGQPRPDRNPYTTPR